MGNYNETPFGQAVLALRRLVFVMARIGIGAKIGVGYGYKKPVLASIGLAYRRQVKIGEEIQFFRRVKWERTRHQRLARQVVAILYSICIEPFTLIRFFVTII